MKQNKFFVLETLFVDDSARIYFVWRLEGKNGLEFAKYFDVKDCWFGTN